MITLGLNGGGDVIEVKGDDLRDWAVRQDGGKRFLDLRPTLKDGQPGPQRLNVTVKVKIEKPTGTVTLPTLSPGDAVGFASQIKLLPGDAVDVRVTRADGLVPLGPDRHLDLCGDLVRAEARRVFRGGGKKERRFRDHAMRLQHQMPVARSHLRGDARTVGLHFILGKGGIRWKGKPGQEEDGEGGFHTMGF